MCTGPHDCGPREWCVCFSTTDDARAAREPRGEILQALTCPPGTRRPAVVASA